MWDTRHEPGWRRGVVGLGQPRELNGNACDLVDSVLGVILRPDDLPACCQQAQRARDPIGNRIIKLVVEPLRGGAQ